LIKAIICSLFDVYNSGEYDNEIVALTFHALHVGSVSDRRYYKDEAVRIIAAFKQGSN
jgi:hypothetical protein